VTRELKEGDEINISYGEIRIAYFLSTRKLAIPCRTSNWPNEIGSQKTNAEGKVLL